MSKLALTRTTILSAAAVAVVLSAPPPAMSAQPDLPNARPGECYGKVTLPAVYGPSRERVLEKGAWTETRKVAGARKAVRRVLVRPARTERVRVSPVWREEVRWVSRPGERRIIVEPARYEIVQEKVMVEAAHAEWRRTSAPLAYGESYYGQTVVQPTGEIVCRVWIPARYEMRSRKVMVAPERTYEERGPERQEKHVSRVLVRKGGWVVRKRPAVYRTEYAPAGPSRTVKVEHPARYREIERSAVVKPEREGWARVVCGGAINPAYMMRVQQALIARGFDPGPPDGVGRPQTYAALRSFQQQNRLAQGQLTEESVRALGL